MKTAFCFPGQGTQTVGMGVAYADVSPAAAAVIAEASEAFGADLLELCRSGPQERLDQTEITQPALASRISSTRRPVWSPNQPQA